MVGYLESQSKNFYFVQMLELSIYGSRSRGAAPGAQPLLARRPCQGAPVLRNASYVCHEGETL